MWMNFTKVVYLDRSRAPETSHGFQDCFPQSARQSTEVRRVCLKKNCVTETSRVGQTTRWSYPLGVMFTLSLKKVACSYICVCRILKCLLSLLIQHTGGFMFKDFVLSCRVTHSNNSKWRIQWTSGRPMYTDSARVCWRFRCVGLLCSFSPFNPLLLFFWLGAPHSRLCREGAETPQSPVW